MSVHPLEPSWIDTFQFAPVIQGILFSTPVYYYVWWHICITRLHQQFFGVVRHFFQHPLLSEGPSIIVNIFTYDNSYHNFLTPSFPPLTIVNDNYRIYRTPWAPCKWKCWQLWTALNWKSSTLHMLECKVPGCIETCLVFDFQAQHFQNVVTCPAWPTYFAQPCITRTVCWASIRSRRFGTLVTLIIG